MILMISRKSTSRGRPMCYGVESNGSMICHSASNTHLVDTLFVSLF